jgi:SAM-dependent methyltransferase
MSPSALTVPARMAWAVNLLDVQPADQILEIGWTRRRCLAGLWPPRRWTDHRHRPFRDIHRADSRAHRGPGQGRTSCDRERDRAGFKGEWDQFDKAFAVNVNVFWTTAAAPECEVLGRVLRPGGLLRLVYAEDPSGRARDVGAEIMPKLERHGFGCDLTGQPTAGMVCVTGRLRR